MSTAAQPLGDQDTPGPDQATIEDDLARVDVDLKQHRLSLDEIVESGREIRAEMVKERYGLDG